MGDISIQGGGKLFLQGEAINEVDIKELFSFFSLLFAFFVKEIIDF